MSNDDKDKLLSDQYLVNINIDPHYSELSVARPFVVITFVFPSLTFSVPFVAACCKIVIMTTHFHECRHLIQLYLAEDRTVVGFDVAKQGTISFFPL
jgi:hypothetical protein